MPMISAITDTHGDHPAIASVAQWPEILHLLPQGQIASHNAPTHTQL